MIKTNEDYQVIYDDDCPACKEAKGIVLITREAHTCGICWACRQGTMVTILSHTCGIK